MALPIVRRASGKIYRQYGKIIRATVTSLAAFRRCCCVDQTICCCPQLDSLPLPKLKATMAGDHTGTSGDIPGDLSAVCGVWPPLSDPTAGNFSISGASCGITEVSVDVICPNPELGVNGFDVTLNPLDGPLAECGYELTPTLATCDHNGTGKIRLEFDWEVVELIPSCGCAGDTGTLVIEEV